MYDNPKHIKDHRVNARFNDDEIEAINSVANLTGLQKSTLVRKATLRLVEELKAEFERNLSGMEDAV
ncbi:hypothetical protein ACPESL_08095 [Psychrobacter pocilloporae]|uniref:hypothetical protein n=1 Tax=Psychrobacter pocilloporae TaxID=1775882 RepID=UPI003C30DC9B